MKYKFLIIIIYNAYSGYSSVYNNEVDLKDPIK